MPIEVQNRLTLTAAVAAMAGALALVPAAAGIMILGGFGVTFVAGVVVPYLAATAVIVARIGRSHTHARFGVANVITLVRLVLACLFSGYVLELVAHRVVVSPALAWLFFSMAVIGLVLDGLDGFAARRQKLESAFGSRFDMETDALHIMLLSIAAFVLAKAGGWVLMSGALRYLFLGVGLIWRPLTRPLPPSRRRKVISATQGGVLAALLAPIIVPPLSTFAAALALGVLIYSFTTDVIWLIRARSNALGSSK